MIRTERYYTVAVLLEGEPCLVVGGGRVAERKVVGLLEAGACVRVVARDTCESLREAAESGRIELRLGEVTASDLDDPVLVIAATDDTEVNAWVAGECRARRIPVNVVDVPALCTFYVPATVRRGPLAISIMTGGEAPALAKRLRRHIEEHVGEEYGLLASLMGSLRGEVRAETAELPNRTEAWRRLAESEEVLSLLADGREGEARALARRILGLDLDA